MLSFLLTRRVDPPLHLVSSKQQRSTFRLVSISTTSFLLPLIVSEYSVPNRIGQFPAGLLPWPEVAWTIKSSVVDLTFIQYLGINFTLGCPSWQKPFISLENWVFLPNTSYRQYTSSKLNQHATCLDLHQYHSKGRDMRHPKHAFCRSSEITSWHYGEVGLACE